MHGLKFTEREYIHCWETSKRLHYKYLENQSKKIRKKKYLKQLYLAANNSYSSLVLSKLSACIHSSKRTLSINEFFKSAYQLTL